MFSKLSLTKENEIKYNTVAVADSICIYVKLFLITYSYTCKIAKDAFRIVLYVTFYKQHCAAARFVSKSDLSTYFVAEMYNVVCY